MLWRIIVNDGVYSLSQVVVRGELVSQVGEDLFSDSDPERLRGLIKRLSEAGEAMVVRGEDLVDLELLESMHFIVQKEVLDGEWPEWVDVRGEDDEVLGFISEEAGEEYISELIESAFSRANARWEKIDKKFQSEKELYEARKKVLEAAGLWDPSALGMIFTSNRARPERVSRARFRVVAIGDSDWSKSRY